MAALLAGLSVVTLVAKMDTKRAEQLVELLELQMVD